MATPVIATAPLKLIVGLGNPGADYEKTRHNAGFWFLDALARQLGASWLPDKKFHGWVARAGSLHLLKPSTFMNRSGLATASVAQFYQIPAESVLVVHDELDLKVGQNKLKIGGGHAGHNGLKDIQAALGTPNFWRLRLGIGHPRDGLTPEQPVFDFVLKPPLKSEQSRIDEATHHALTAWDLLAAGKMTEAQTIVHKSLP
jgi:peptidyl-tRNA hydrolase, PTH1 family